jgi:hypothetical protein
MRKKRKLAPLPQPWDRIVADLKNGDSIKQVARRYGTTYTLLNNRIVREFRTLDKLRHPVEQEKDNQERREVRAPGCERLKICHTWRGCYLHQGCGAAQASRKTIQIRPGRVIRASV